MGWCTQVKQLQNDYTDVFANDPGSNVTGQSVVKNIDNIDDMFIHNTDIMKKWVQSND